MQPFPNLFNETPHLYDGKRNEKKDNRPRRNPTRKIYGETLGSKTLFSQSLAFTTIENSFPRTSKQRLRFLSEKNGGIIEKNHFLGGRQ